MDHYDDINKIAEQIFLDIKEYDDECKEIIIKLLKNEIVKLYFFYRFLHNPTYIIYCFKTINIVFICFIFLY